MKQSPLVAVSICVLSLAGCASKDVSVKVPGKLAQPAAEYVAARGKPESWRAPVSVDNMDGMSEELYSDLRKNFIEPLQSGPYRYTIESIRLAAVPGLVNEWTMLMSLDDGAAIRVDNFSQWDERTQSYFHDGYRRTLTGLAKVQRKDEALNRYVTKVTKPLKPTQAEIRMAKLEAIAEGDDSE